MGDNFSANESVLGYLFQIRYSLYEIIKPDRDEGANISIEFLDDFDIYDSSSIRNVAQLKHHLKTTANLQNSSSDIWKTLRIWINLYQRGIIDIDETTFFLITTADISDGSIAYYLLDDDNRNIDKAVKKLTEIADNKGNKKFKKSYEAFLDLSKAEQSLLVSNIIIKGNIKPIDEINGLIKNILKYSVDDKFVDSAFSRLEGWWFQKSIEILISAKPRYIKRQTILKKIRDLASQFQIDSLPIDYLHIDLPEEQVSDYKDELFVQQLKSISTSQERIKNCIYDYYKAYKQRHDWIYEELLIDDELENYEKTLVQEWNRQITILKDEEDLDETASEEDFKKFGKKLLRWVELQANFKIRSEVKDNGYVMRGSYHMLANENDPEPRVYWHPQFLEKFKQVISN
ncbi:ABC-three component system protein [Fodinibius salsisoli]|uniref:ABC-three component systems C-terminal domain-containing protein n=1 Tax=Fodinibius salsisoli TaxID=2820877 RepID=A0ABT3PKN7_9BACT|nr:ABC-three component system protein [Fodinibius salsisoli]MCW9705774.1 hypothetical protein [Fodinibius salsisoli]